MIQGHYDKVPLGKDFKVPGTTPAHQSKDPGSLPDSCAFDLQVLHTLWRLRILTQHYKQLCHGMEMSQTQYSPLPSQVCIS